VVPEDRRRFDGVVERDGRRHRDERRVVHRPAALADAERLPDPGASDLGLATLLPLRWPGVLS
jgi:hypothetical protein